jgi:tRNA-specific 2-thiouridylase
MRPAVSARVTPLENRSALVELYSPEDGIAPGQACVFYALGGTQVLGGGWIARAEAQAEAAE